MFPEAAGGNLELSAVAGGLTDVSHTRLLLCWGDLAAWCQSVQVWITLCTSYNGETYYLGHLELERANRHKNYSPKLHSLVYYNIIYIKLF